MVNADELDTNLQIFKDLVRQGLCEEYPNISDSLYYHIKAPKTVQWLVDEQINACAKQNGTTALFMVRQKPYSLVTLYLEFSWLAHNIEYRSNSLLPDNNLKRTVELDYHIKLVTDANQVLVSKNLLKVHQDTVLTSQVKQLENPDIPITIGKKSTRFFKVFEPLLVIGVTGVIVYIFYAFRSN